MKTYDATHGITLDQSFSSHQETCEHCKQYDAEKPASAARLCLEGAILLKRQVQKPVPKAKCEASEYRTTKSAAKAAMRYK